MRFVFAAILVILYPTMLAYGYSQGELFGNNGVFWPAAGILVGGLTLLPYRWWLPALIGSYFVENALYTHLSSESRALFALPYLSNEAEGALAALTLRFMASPGKRHSSLRGYLRLGVAGWLVGATFGAVVSTLPVLQQMDSSQAFSVWRLRWLADTIGVLTVAPLVLWSWELLTNRKLPPSKASTPEIVVTSAAILAIVYYLFSLPHGLIQPFLLYPPMLWMSARLGPFLTSWVLTAGVFIAVEYTGTGLGPFVSLGGIEDISLSLQVFLGGLVSSVLAFSCNLADRDRSVLRKERALESLEKSERRYQALFEHTAVPILVLGDDTIERFNPAAHRLFGRGEDELRVSLQELSATRQASGLEFSDLWPGAFQDDAVIPWTAKLPNGDPLELDLYVSTVKLKEGEKTQVVARDKTHQMRLERMLENERTALSEEVTRQTAELIETNDQLADANLARRRFLGTISHELRTPLTAIFGKCETLKEGLWGPLSQEQLNSLDRIAASADHLGTLIKDLLDMAKVEDPDVKPEIGIHDLQDICLSTIRLVTTMARHHHIELQHDPFPEEEIRVDARFCKQVLVSLLANAIKFTPSGGRVGLEVSVQGDTVTFKVWDSGPGIPADQRDILFLPFVRDGREVPGQGLGLALVSRLCKAMGGKVEVGESDSGGALFKVQIPRVGGQEKNLDKTRLTLLLRELRDGSLTNAYAYFQEQGHRVLKTSATSEFLRILEEESPEALLVELQESSTDSLEILRALEEREPCLPVILLARDYGDTCRRLLEKTRASEVVRMPTALPDLEDTVQDLVKARRRPKE